MSQTWLFLFYRYRRAHTRTHNITEQKWVQKSPLSKSFFAIFFSEMNATWRHTNAKSSVSNVIVHGGMSQMRLILSEFGIASHITWRYENWYFTYTHEIELDVVLAQPNSLSNDRKIQHHSITKRIWFKDASRCSQMTKRIRITYIEQHYKAHHNEFRQSFCDLTWCVEWWRSSMIHFMSAPKTKKRQHFVSIVCHTLQTLPSLFVAQKKNRNKKSFRSKSRA